MIRLACFDSLSSSSTLHFALAEHPLSYIVDLLMWRYFMILGTFTLCLHILVCGVGKRRSIAMVLAAGVLPPR